MARTLRNLQVDLRILEQIVREHRRQKFEQSSGVGKQAYAAPQAVRELKQLATHDLVLLQDRPRMARQHTAGRRRPDATRFAEQKLRADLMLHVADPFACGGRSYVCVASTLRDTRRFHHTQEQTEIRQIKTHVSVSTVPSGKWLEFGVARSP